MIKAALYEGKDSIRVGTCAPAVPGEGQVQIRVSHCGICGTDLHIFHGKMDGRVSIPQVLGHEMSGTICAVGVGASQWSVGDRVTVRPLNPCGNCPACTSGHRHICMNLKFLGIDAPGAMQSLWTVPAHTLHRLPDSLSYEQAALIEPLAVAVHDVRLGDVKAEEYVVVQGGGPIGLLVAMVARLAGALVLLTEVNPFRIRFAQELGFDVINPDEADVVAHVSSRTGGAGADVVFEVSGSAAGAELMTKLPRTRGRIVVVAIFAKAPAIDLFRMFWREISLKGARVYEPEDFDQAIVLAASGRLPLDRIISKVIPIDAVESGFREIEQGGDVVKVLVRCSQ